MSEVDSPSPVLDTDSGEQVRGNSGRESPTAAGSPSSYSYSYHERLVAFYERYAPEKLSVIDTALFAYKGREEEMFATLREKYGPEPLSLLAKPHSVASPLLGTGEAENGNKEDSNEDTPKPDHSGTGNTLKVPTATARHTSSALRERLVHFYLQYAPEKIFNINDIMVMYQRKPEGEQELFEELVHRYGPEPNVEEQKERLGLFYQYYAPEKLPAVSDILIAFAGESELLFALLKDQYGPEPAGVTESGQTLSPHEAEKETTRQRLLQFYTYYAPEKIPGVEDIVSLCHPSLSSPLLEKDQLAKDSEGGISSSSDTQQPPTQQEYQPFHRDVFQLLVEKYGPEPHVLHSGGRLPAAPFAPALPPSIGNITPCAGSRRDPVGDTEDISPPRTPPPPPPTATAPKQEAVGSQRGDGDEHAKNEVPVACVATAGSTGTGKPCDEEEEAPLPMDDYNDTMREEGDGGDDACLHDRSVQERIRTVYEFYAPEKIATLANALAAYEGREFEMLSMLTAKYGPEPTRRQWLDMQRLKGASAAAEEVEMLSPQMQQELLEEAEQLGDGASTHSSATAYTTATNELQHGPVGPSAASDVGGAGTGTGKTKRRKRGESTAAKNRTGPFNYASYLNQLSRTQHPEEAVNPHPNSALNDYVAQTGGRSAVQQGQAQVGSPEGEEEEAGRMVSAVVPLQMYAEFGEDPTKTATYRQGTAEDHAEVEELMAELGATTVSISPNDGAKEGQTAAETQSLYSFAEVVSFVAFFFNSSSNPQTAQDIQLPKPIEPQDERAFQYIKAIRLIEITEEEERAALQSDAKRKHMQLSTEFNQGLSAARLVQTLAVTSRTEETLRAMLLDQEELERFGVVRLMSAELPERTLPAIPVVDDSHHQSDVTTAVAAAETEIAVSPPQRQRSSSVDQQWNAFVQQSRKEMPIGVAAASPTPVGPAASPSPRRSPTPKASSEPVGDHSNRKSKSPSAGRFPRGGDAKATIPPALPTTRTAVLRVSSLVGMSTNKRPELYHLHNRLQREEMARRKAEAAKEARTKVMLAALEGDESALEQAVRDIDAAEAPPSLSETPPKQSKSLDEKKSGKTPKISKKNEAELDTEEKKKRLHVTRPTSLSRDLHPLVPAIRPTQPQPFHLSTAPSKWVERAEHHLGERRMKDRGCSPPSSPRGGVSKPTIAAVATPPMRHEEKEESQEPKQEQRARGGAVQVECGPPISVLVPGPVLEANHQSRGESVAESPPAKKNSSPSPKTKGAPQYRSSSAVVTRLRLKYGITDSGTVGGAKGSSHEQTKGIVPPSNPSPERTHPSASSGGGTPRRAATGLATKTTPGSATAKPAAFSSFGNRVPLTKHRFSSQLPAARYVPVPRDK